MAAVGEVPEASAPSEADVVTHARPRVGSAPTDQAFLQDALQLYGMRGMRAYAIFRIVRH